MTKKHTAISLVLISSLALLLSQGSRRGDTRPQSRKQGIRLHRVLQVRADGRLRIPSLAAKAASPWFRLQGIQTPSVARLRAFLAALRSRLQYREFRVELEGSERGGGACITLFEPGTKGSVNERILADGLAWFHSTTQKVRLQDRLLAASQRAKAAGKGLWKTTLRVKGSPPLQRGAVLGLYYREERFDYHQQIDRIVAIGAQWVSFLVTCFVDKVDSVEIEFDKERTVKDARLVETLAYARKKGLRLGLLPIVLIRNADDEDWRGTLRPTDPQMFWRSYDRFLMHYLDIAREARVELFSVGSEFCSLETQHDAWTRVIQNARGRYGGWLSYSVNWDHYEVPRFWDQIDQVGMTAYFELTKDKDADLAALKKAWQKVRKDLSQAAKNMGRKIVLTELGYASQDGCNTAPWNYFLAPDQIDLGEQADCFKAFAAVMGNAPLLQGVYAYDFFEEGGIKDSSYALWGKPAWKVVKALLRDFRSDQRQSERGAKKH